jgi:hypothetical protein
MDGTASQPEATGASAVRQEVGKGGDFSGEQPFWKQQRTEFEETWWLKQLPPPPFVFACMTSILFGFLRR